MLEHFGVTEANWREATGPALLHLRVAAASSAAPSPRWPPTPTSTAGHGQSLSSGGLAQVYGFTDIDGTRPDCLALHRRAPRGRPARPTTAGYR